MTPFAESVFGNSSGVHDTSRKAKNALESAREGLAALIGAGPMEIVFTSGGTESDNLALKGVAMNSSPRRGVVTAATEHDAILETVDFLSRTGSPTTIVGVDPSGHVDRTDLLAAVNSGTAVVSVMVANNETGAMSDVGSLAAAVKSQGADVVFHSDAVQAAAFLDLDVDALGVDLLSLSAHKIGGPKGVGVLYVRERTALEPVLHGGGQELGRRSGTHNVAGAVGMAKALELAVAERESFISQVGGLRDDLSKRLQAGLPDIRLNTPDSAAPHILNVRIPDVRNETLLMRLDREGVAASAGSACQSGAATVSHVLEAMGRTPQEARESIRFSLGRTNTADEIIEVAEKTVSLVGDLR